MVTKEIRRAVLAVLLLLPACGEDQRVEAPDPQELTREAIGHYCNMIVEDHPGPKGQIFLTDRAEPIWFSSVRDTVAFTRLPEEAKNIAAIYVNDMGQASWAAPEAGTWIDAKAAWYVIGSGRRGGMGAPETVPFSERPAAEAFVAKHGGSVVAFADIPADAVLGEVPDSHHSGASHGQHDSPAHRHAAGHDKGHDKGHDRHETQEAHQ
ncbi:MAG: nitrous oxide reductase accessory protein NosL [Kiloniellales bacterium]|nr:nitrous oxide reductase accessory protein NosL [Kiloniellales bacterium]